MKPKHQPAAAAASKQQQPEQLQSNSPQQREHQLKQQHKQQHLKIVGLEEQCARLKQQKRVAERYATAQAAEAEAAREEIAQLRAKLEHARQRATFYERTAEQRLSEVKTLRRELCTSFKARVEGDVFRAVEATGQADLFPATLMPTLAAVASSLATEALQQRAARLAAPDSHPLGLHPGVHEWASLHDTCGRLFAPLEL